MDIMSFSLLFPKRFLYELAQIPDFAGRAHCIIFQAVFLDSISSIHGKVEIISAVCKVCPGRASRHADMRIIVFSIIAKDERELSFS